MLYPNININAKTRTFGSPLNVAANKWLSLKNNPSKLKEGILNIIRSLLAKNGIEYYLEEVRKMTDDDPIIMNLFPANK